MCIKGPKSIWKDGLLCNSNYVTLRKAGRSGAGGRVQRSVVASSAACGRDEQVEDFQGSETIHATVQRCTPVIKHLSELRT